MTKAKRQATEVALRLQFSDAERTTILRAAREVWSEIGFDVITQGTGREKDAKNVRRAVVLEVVIDANRLEAQISDKALRARFAALDYEAMKTLVGPAFPDQWYGL